MSVQDLVGQQFGRWTIQHMGRPAKHRKVTAQCTCGVVRHVQLSDIRSGKSRSCGCWKRETASAHTKTHGESRRTHEYSVWAAMLSRCRDAHNTRFQDYGGRGITVCRRWLKYENFLADMGRCPEKHRLERKNNNCGYTPRNCCWATITQQAWNKRNNRLLTYKGECLPLTEWARRLGIRHATLRERLARGWPLADVFNQKKHHGRSRLADH